MVPRATSLLALRHSGKAATRAARTAVTAAPWHATAYAAAALASGTLPVAAAWLLKHIVDNLSRAGTVQVGQLVAPSCGLAAIGLVAGTVPHLQRYVGAELARRSTMLAKATLYTAVNRLNGLARFEDPAHLDRIELARQAGDSAPPQILRSGLTVAQAALTAFGFIGTLAVLNPVLAAFVVASAIPAVFAQFALSQRRAEMIALTTPMHRRHVFFAALLTQLQAVKEIRLFDLGGFLQTRMLDEQQRYNREQRRVDRHDVRVQANLAVLTAVVSAAALLWAVIAAARGLLTVGDVTILIAAVAGVQAALTTIVDTIAESHEALLVYKNYVAVVDSEPDLSVSAAHRSPGALRTGIDFEDVWFRYSDEQPWVLRGLTMSLTAGRSCALVGVNGSGKSTVVKLLCRYYDPQRGAIRWDGIDLRDFDPAELRRRLGVLFQDFMCYDLSARENVGLGDLRQLHQPGSVEAAASLAGIHDAISALPRGYDTALTRLFFATEEASPASGVLLSGGQWQRVALARTLLRSDRDLLVLDEPSAGLDAIAEFEIHTRLTALRKGRTSLLISHRLSALRDADSIVVLADGAVVERGSHGELMKARGEYHRLFQMQARGYARSDAEVIDGVCTCGAGSGRAGDHGLVVSPKRGDGDRERPKYGAIPA